MNMNKEQIELTKELEEKFQHYDEVFKNGCDDPLWTDGVNLNLIRNHIIIGKGIIKEAFPDGEYPDVFYKKTPDEIDDDYMAKADEIRTNAKELYKIFKNYPFLYELECADYYLDQKQMLDTGIQRVLSLINNLDEAIKTDDLVSMRRISKNPEEKMEAVEKAYENLREINMQEERQIFFFEIKM